MPLGLSILTHALRASLLGTMTFAALEIWHILCDILMYLPEQDLLVAAQRVCRQWRYIIKNTKVLQEALFLCPSQDSSTVSSGLRLNPLLQCRFPALFDGLWHAKTLTTVVGPWGTMDWSRGTIHHGPSLDAEPESGPDATALARMDAYSRSTASWRKMAPCSPAPTELQASYALRRGTRGSLRRCMFRTLKFGHRSGTNTSNSGRGQHDFVTFGLIYDIVESSWCGHDPEGAKIVRIDYFRPSYTASSDDDETRQSLRDAFSEASIGGFSKVLIHLDRRAQCGEASRTMNRRMATTWRKQRFQSQGRMMLSDVIWDRALTYS